MLLGNGHEGHEELKALKEHVDNRFKMMDDRFSDRFSACEKILKRLRNESMNIWEHVQFLAEGERERRRSSSSSAAEAPSAEAPSAEAPSAEASLAKAPSAAEE